MRGLQPASAPNVGAAIAEEPAAGNPHGRVCEGCALKRNEFSGLRWPPWQSLASSHVSSLAWAGGNTHCEA
jgi:hypothetical protein